MSNVEGQTMTDGRVIAARALDPLLQVFRSVSGAELRAVHGVYVHACLAERVLVFDGMALVIEAQPEFDTVGVAIEISPAMTRAGGVDESGSMPWKRFIGQPFGWGWIAMNPQGYCDTVLLSFGGIAAQLLQSVVASRLDEKVIGVG